MDFGLQIPSTMPGVSREAILEWARFIDQGPFASLGAPDRYMYDTLDPITTLAAVSSVTDRVRLATTCVIAGLRGPAGFAKQIGTLSVLAPGRLTVGVIVGARPNDYEAAGVDWEQRGLILDDTLEFLEESGRGTAEDELGPRHRDFEILIGGASPPALRRLTRFGDGYMSGGIKPEFFGYDAMAVQNAWKEAGRESRPRLVAGTWYASSLDPDDAATAHHASYFQLGGPPPPVDIGIVRGKDAVKETIEAFAERGADEVMFWPMVDDISEAAWLADLISEL